MEAEFYPSVEHAYQAAKTINPGIRRAISMAVTPGAAKRLGKGLDIRHGWDGMKMKIMEDLVRQKFIRNEELKWKLLATGDRPLFEGNNWGDRFWGVCTADDGGMVGENNLGKIIMKVREELSHGRG
jgi:ribA/ribD-fused uncharacterized protein